MNPNSSTHFKGWRAEQLKDPEFIASLRGLELAEQLLLLRNRCGLTKRELAAMVGTNPTTISRIENGKATPTIKFLRQIVDALDSIVEIRIIPKASIISKDREQANRMV